MPRLAVFMLATALAAAPAAAVTDGPSAVSPGQLEHAVAIAGPCPTFSWSHAATADGFELVVYRIDLDDVERVIHERLTGGARSWTPSLDRCLDTRGRFGWAVRSERAGVFTEWSTPLFFELPEAPSLAEVEAALAVLQRFRDAASAEPAAELRDRQPQLALSPRPLPLRSRPAAPSHSGGGPGETEAVESSTSGTAARSSSSSAVGLDSAALSVRGEIRTLDPQGQPRVWGSGRAGVDDLYGMLFGPCSGEGALRFGLSTIAVDWGSASSACPAGTWVCRSADLISESCNTGRPDSLGDAASCSGALVDHPSDAHRGWISDRLDDLNGSVKVENGNNTGATTCSILPVWCCWEG